MLLPALLAALPGVLANEPVACGSDHLSCDFHNNTLIGVFEAPSLEECSEICLADANCRFYTYFDGESFPLTSDCFTFTSCNSVQRCDHCVSEARHCRQNCNVARTGKIGEGNLVDFLDGVGSEFECRELCQKAAGCSFFTYFNETDPELPKICTLLSQLLPPFQDCEHCWTGPKYSPSECRDGYCLLTHNGAYTNSVMLTESGTVETTAFLTECQVKILAVGGGGKRFFGGGGSGFVEEIDLTFPSSAEITVKIGGSGEDTVVQTSTGDVLTARAGGTGFDGHGGNGYSGGGYGRQGSMDGNAGGSNGGDGDGPGAGGGKGSHVDLSSFTFNHFQLAAGQGGSSYSSYGGGGGGVVIDGKSPEGSGTEGEGYGGGGGYTNRQGLPGAVLMEIQSN